MESEDNLTYDPVKELGDMPEFGVVFKFNADYDNVQWYGLGEAETYADRKKVQNWAFIRTKLWTTWQDTWYRRNVEQKRKYAGRRSQTARQRNVL